MEERIMEVILRVLRKTLLRLKVRLKTDGDKERRKPVITISFAYYKCIGSKYSCAICMYLLLCHQLLIKVILSFPIKMLIRGIFSLVYGRCPSVGKDKKN